MYADYHLHTEFSDDSEELMEKQVEAAIAKGLEEMCVTDHVDYGIKRDWDDPRGMLYRGMDGNVGDGEGMMPCANVDYPAYFAKLDRMRQLYGDRIVIRNGLEFGIQSITVEDYEKLYPTAVRAFLEKSCLMTINTSWISCCFPCIRWIIWNSGHRISSAAEHSRNTTRSITMKSIRP